MVALRRTGTGALLKLIDCTAVHFCTTTHAHSANRIEICRFLQGCAFGTQPIVHFLGLFNLALLALKTSLNLFSSLKIIAMAFLCTNTCEFLIFLATLPKNKNKNFYKHNMNERKPFLIKIQHRNKRKWIK